MVIKLFQVYFVGDLLDLLPFPDNMMLYYHVPEINTS